MADLRDDELLGALERSIGAAPAEPSAAEVRGFLAEVSAATPARAVAAGRRTRWLPRLLAGTVAAAALSGGTAYALGDGSLPSPVRRAAVALRLPVDAPAEAEAKAALASLERAIASGDRDAIRDALDELEDAFEELDADQIEEFGPRALQLAADATRALQQLEDADDDAGDGDGDGDGDDDGDRSGPSSDGGDVDDDSSGSGSSGSGSSGSDDTDSSGSGSGSDDSSGSGSSGSGSSGSGSSGSGSSGSGSGSDDG